MSLGAWGPLCTDAAGRGCSLSGVFHFLAQQWKVKGFPACPGCQQGRAGRTWEGKEKRITPQPQALAISGRVGHLGVGGELVSKPAQRGWDWVYV